MFSSAKHPVLTGTAILTCAGTLSRLIGFFYRIFLSRTIGAQGLGIYQMIFPVYAFCLSGVTALSKGNPRKGWVFFLSGSGLSVGLSLIVSFFLYTRAPWISLHILHEIRCCELLQLLAFSLPLCSIHTCIHAWYFSTRRTTVPAVSQLLEQFARVGASYVIYLIFLEQNLAPTPILAVACFSENWRHASSALSVSLSRNLPIKALPTFASVPASGKSLPYPSRSP